MKTLAWCVCIAATGAAAACASSGGTSTTSSTPGTPSTAGPGLAYEVTGPASATYELSDTSVVQLDAGGNQVRVDVASRVAAAVDVSPASDGVRATVRITAVDGYSSNSMGSSVTIGAGDVPGPAELSVTRDGVVNIVQRPDMTSNFQRIIAAVELYRRFFLRLPDRTVARGVAWTDTIPLTDVTQGLNVQSTSVVTSTWERDTTVGGRTLRVITSNAVSNARIYGNTEGVDIEQQMSGQSNATTLWDPERRMIVERREISDGSGTTNLPSMGVTGLPTSTQSVVTIRRVER